MLPSRRLTLVAACLSILCASAATAGEVERTEAFALDRWIPLEVSDGPVTLHRIRLASSSRSPKSKLMRPGNDEYLADVQVQLEFTNDATRDWEASLRIEWLDAAGHVVDGYRDTEELDSDSRHDVQTVTLSTLRYGLERASKLRVRIELHRE